MLAGMAMGLVRGTGCSESLLLVDAFSGAPRLSYDTLEILRVESAPEELFAAGEGVVWWKVRDLQFVDDSVVFKNQKTVPISQDGFSW